MAADPAHDDVVLGKALDPQLLRRLLRYARPYRGRMALSFMLILLVTALSLVGPYLGKVAIDGPLAESIESAQERSEVDTDALTELGTIATIFVGVSAVLLILRFAQTMIMAQVGQRVMFDLRMELFRHLQRMPLAYFDRNPVGRLVTRITSDIEALNELFASGVITFLADVLVLVGIGIALLVMNPQLAAVTLAALPFLLFATFVFRNKARKYYREQRRHLSHLNAYTQESIQGMNIVQVFDQQHAGHARFQKINGRYLTAFLRTVLAYAIYFPTIEVLSNLALVAIIWFSSRLMETGELTYGQFWYFWVFLGRFFHPIRDMAERYNVLQSAMAASERVFGVLDMEPGMESTPATSKSGQSGPTPRGHIAFRNVWFSYRDDEPVLRDVNFEVRPGETVAIVGATGAGKSTITSLLSRMYDVQEGSVEVDGRDVREYDKAELRRRVGIVLQDVFLFSRSIRENVQLGNRDITDEKLNAALQAVGADRFVSTLPEGVDHVLTERGSSLSVGEKQLLAFARVLAHNPDFLVLDEATAHVDTETELLIEKAIETILDGRTSIVVAHRLSTIRRADRIIVLHKGKIRESGTHAELLKAGGIYSRLHSLQYR